MFLSILILLYFSSQNKNTTPSSSLDLINLPTQNFSTNFSTLLNTSINSTIEMKNFSDQQPITNQSLNCTPIGNPAKLLLLSTSYKLYFGEEPIYVRSKLSNIIGDKIIISQEITRDYNGKTSTTHTMSTYGPDGKCINTQVLTDDLGTPIPQSQSTFPCSGYPFWVVCREYINGTFFDKNITVNIHGKDYIVGVYKLNGSEIRIGYDPPIIFGYSFTDSITNKSFTAQLLDIGGN